MTEDQMRILEVWDDVEDRMPDKSTEMIAQFTASEAEVDYVDVMDALFARSQDSLFAGRQESS
jgi:hypothetical protein